MAPASGSTAAATPMLAAPSGDRDERRTEPSQVEALERVDVTDHAGEEISASVALELCRRERLDALEEARPCLSERAQGDVVRDEPLEVARQRPGQAEEADRDDRHRQRKDRRPFGGARDQVARRRHERDAEADRESAEDDRERHPSHRHAGEREQAPEGSHQAVSGVADGDPPALEPYDAVSPGGKLRAVGDEEHRASLPQPFDRLADELGAVRIEVGGGLVEDHERRVAEERARERDPL